MNLEHVQYNQPRWHQQTKPVSAIPPILGEQVWTGLSEAQRQTVAATIVRICQALAHQPARPTESESTTYEPIG